MSNEYYLAAQHFNIDQKAISKLSEQAADAIFSGPAEHARLRNIYAEWNSTIQ